MLKSCTIISSLGTRLHFVHQTKARWLVHNLSIVFVEISTVIERHVVFSKSTVWISVELFLSSVALVFIGLAHIISIPGMSGHDVRLLGFQLDHLTEVSMRLIEAIFVLVVHV